MRYGGSDFYTDENGVLKNKLGIKNSKELENLERDITTIRLIQLNNPPISRNFDLRHLQDIHHFIFSPIYDWAGEIRNGSLAKGETVFTYPERIIPELNKLFAQLRLENYLQGINKENIVQRLAYYLGELNVIHPFREGNGRVQRAFISELAERLGYELDFSNVSQQEMIDASILAYRKLDYSELAKIINKSITYSKCDSINEIIDLKTEDKERNEQAYSFKP